MARLRESAILIAPQETQMKNYACHIYLHKMIIPNFLMNSFWGAETCGKKKSVALAGNRTRASRVAGENSTTEPPMLSLEVDFHTLLE